MRTYYLNVLGLGTNATLTDIKKAYRMLARKYHPDVCTLPNAKDKFIAVKEAYTYLTSPQKTPPKKQQVWKQPAATTPKATKAKSEVEKRREQMREKLQKEKEQEEAEAREDARLRKLPLKEFMQSDYFKNTLGHFRAMTRSIMFWVFLLIRYLLGFAFLAGENYLTGIMFFCAPPAFVLYALFSRP